MSLSRWRLAALLLQMGVPLACSTFVQLASQVALSSFPSLGYSLKELAAEEYQEASQAWVLHDFHGSIQLSLKSAQKGYEVGDYCFRWGQYHELPPSDVKQALRWYKRGARMRHKGCTLMLGRLFFLMGQHSDAQEALSHAASPEGEGSWGNDALAQWFLGEVSMRAGAMRQAVRWWKRSAESGDVDAMMRLVQVFAQGAIGIPQELMRARYWITVAAAHGHQEALQQKLIWADPDRPRVEDRWIRRMELRGWL